MAIRRMSLCLVLLTTGSVVLADSWSPISIVDPPHGLRSQILDPVGSAPRIPGRPRPQPTHRLAAKATPRFGQDMRCSSGAEMTEKTSLTRAAVTIPLPTPGDQPLSQEHRRDASGIRSSGVVIG